MEKSTPRNLLAKTLLFIFLFTGIAGLRFFYCTKLPVNTGDIPRHLYHALYAGEYGLEKAGYNLEELNPALNWVSWSDMPYNYPIITLLFFIGICKISPTIFFTKFILTLIEGLNTWLIFRYSKQRLLALLYWASPISIWWVSHEGQFEPLQSFFIISALCLFSRKQSWAFMLLALAIQVKLTAILLLPYFLLSIKWENHKSLIRSAIFFVAGFLPTGFAMLYYPVVQQVLGTSSSLHYNPYYWNVLKKSVFNWNPDWLIVINQVVTYGLLIVFAYLMIKQKEIKSFLAPAGFIGFCKISSLAQFWYFILYPAFLLPVQDKRTRLWLFALAPLLDVTSLIQIVSGPFGYTLGEYYISPYMRFRIP